MAFILPAPARAVTLLQVPPAWATARQMVMNNRLGVLRLAHADYRPGDSGHDGMHSAVDALLYITGWRDFSNVRKMGSESVLLAAADTDGGAELRISPVRTDRPCVMTFRGDRASLTITCGEVYIVPEAGGGLLIDAQGHTPRRAPQTLTSAGVLPDELRSITAARSRLV
ncbi:MAG: hypothetical protein WD873_02420 [Candidatus Hydrogenedentales bacterium]